MRFTTAPPTSSARAATRREGRYSRWRVVALVLVHVAIAAHVVHWKLAGRTLAPLELNETIYAIAEGIVTAGFALFALACLATAIFGRFFCSWACHVLALQDLSAWLLRKVGIAPRPLRSRVLRWAPIVVALYMLGWPLVWRAAHEQRVPSFHLRSDAQGWASFVTSDFARNLPGPWIAALTFLVCGFVIVYWLGARAFCQDVCPYGAVFGALDRVAPGRIVARGDCGDCSHCTSVCQSHVRVHQELATFGTVVDPRCLRDLDCVAACPDGKVAFAFTRPPLARAGAVGGLPRRYDLTFGEELVLAAAFLASFLALRGLYGVMPFLLAVALAAIVSTMLVIALRVARRGEVRVQKLVLSRAGRVERPGAVFLGLSSVALAFVAHSGWIRWNELAGESALEAAEQARSPSQARASTSEARTHFERCRAFGLMRSLQLDLRIARAAELAGDLAAAEATLAALPIAGRAGRPVALAHARVSAARGETERARALLAAALSELDDDDRARADGRTFEAQARTLLGTLAANDGDFARARQELELACAVPSASAYAHYQLGVVCFALGDREAALPAFERSCELDGRDADAHNNAGMLLLDLKLAARAEAHLLRAVELAPEHAAARFNLGRALLARGDRAAAEEHLLRARRAGEPYASAVDELLAWP